MSLWLWHLFGLAAGMIPSFRCGCLFWPLSPYYSSRSLIWLSSRLRAFWCFGSLIFFITLFRILRLLCFRLFVTLMRIPSRPCDLASFRQGLFTCLFKPIWITRPPGSCAVIVFVGTFFLSTGPFYWSGPSFFCSFASLLRHCCPQPSCLMPSVFSCSHFSLRAWPWVCFLHWFCWNFCHFRPLWFSRRS